MSLNDELLDAVTNRDLKKVKLILDQGANVNSKDEDGDTPLICAIQEGHTETVEFLIANGADVNLKNNAEGNTVLHFAAGNGHTETVEFLMQNIKF